MYITRVFTLFLSLFLSLSVYAEGQGLRVSFIEEVKETVIEIQSETSDTFIKSIPPDLVALQAIIESGWGTSLYARKANNFFGIYTPYRSYSYRSIKQRGSNLYVRRFDSLEHSVLSYFETLRHPRYENFHKTLSKTKDPIILLRSVVSVYSETKPSEYLSLAKQIYDKYLA